MAVGLVQDFAAWKLFSSCSKPEKHSEPPPLLQHALIKVTDSLWKREREKERERRENE